MTTRIFSRPLIWHIAFSSVLGFVYVKATEPPKPEPVEPTGFVIDSIRT